MTDDSKSAPNNKFDDYKKTLAMPAFRNKL